MEHQQGGGGGHLVMAALGLILRLALGLTPVRLCRFCAQQQAVSLLAARPRAAAWLVSSADVLSIERLSTTAVASAGVAARWLQRASTN
jgi:hypothetical protein